MRSELDKWSNKERIMFLLHAHSAFQYVKAAITFGVIEYLRDHRDVNEVQLLKEINIPEESYICLMQGVISLGVVQRSSATLDLAPSYRELAESEFWPVYCSMVRFQSEICYQGQYYFEDSLRAGKNLGLQAIEGTGKNLYEKFENNLKIKSIFYDYMEKYSSYAMSILLSKISFNEKERILDVGCGKGMSSFRIIQEYPDVKLTMIDLPFLQNEIKDVIRQEFKGKDISFYPVDFFKEEFPYSVEKYDTVLFIHQLVIWSPSEIKFLIKKAVKSLRTNGRVVIFSSISNNDDSGPIMSTLDSVYFKSIATGSGRIYRWKDYLSVLKECGLDSIECISCSDWTPHGVIIGKKSSSPNKND